MEAVAPAVGEAFAGRAGHDVVTLVVVAGLGGFLVRLDAGPFGVEEHPGAVGAQQEVRGDRPGVPAVLGLYGDEAVDEVALPLGSVDVEGGGDQAAGDADAGLVLLGQAARLPGDDRFDGRHSRAWLLTIMRRAEINRHRRRRPHLLDDPDTDLDRLSSVDAVESPEELVVGESFDEAVGAALAALPDRHRQVVRLVDIGGLSYAEAAALLHVPEGTVMSRLHRARKRIRTQLAAAGLAPRRSML